MQRIKRETRLSKKMGRKERVVVTILKEDQLRRSGFTFLVSQRFLVQIWASHLASLYFGSLCKSAEYFIWTEISSGLGLPLCHLCISITCSTVILLETS